MCRDARTDRRRWHGAAVVGASRLPGGEPTVADISAVGAGQGAGFGDSIFDANADELPAQKAGGAYRDGHSGRSGLCGEERVVRDGVCSWWELGSGVERGGDCEAGLYFCWTPEHGIERRIGAAAHAMTGAERGGHEDVSLGLLDMAC